MRLRDRIKAAVQTFREAPDLHSRLTATEHELHLADQTLERMGKECDQLRDTIQEQTSQLTATEDTEEDLSFRL